MSDIAFGDTSRCNLRENMVATLEGNSKMSSSTKRADESWALLARALDKERALKLKTNFKSQFQKFSLSQPHPDYAQPSLNSRSPGSMTFPQVPLADNSWAILARTLANERASKLQNDIIMRTFCERPRSMGMINKFLGKKDQGKTFAKPETVRASSASALGRDPARQSTSPSKGRGKGQIGPMAASCRDSVSNSFLLTARGNDEGPLNKSTMNCDRFQMEAPHGSQNIRNDYLTFGEPGVSAETLCDLNHDEMVRQESSMPDVLVVPPREIMSGVSIKSKCEGPDRGPYRRYQENFRLEMFLRPTVSSQYKALESLIARTFLEERQAKEKLSSDLKNREEANPQVSRHLTRASDFYRQEIPMPKSFPRSRSPKADTTRSPINSRTLLGSSLSGPRKERKCTVCKTTIPGIARIAISQANIFGTEGPTSALANCPSKNDFDNRLDHKIFGNSRKSSTLEQL